MTKPHTRPFTGMPNPNVVWKYEVLINGIVYGYGNTPLDAVLNAEFEHEIERDPDLHT